MDTYTDRSLELITIATIEKGVLRFTNGWNFGGVPKEVLPELAPYNAYFQEQQGSFITGMASTYTLRNGERAINKWLWHKTDAELQQEHEEWQTRRRQEKETSLNNLREDWTRREAALPQALQDRINRFRTAGGHGFELDGWGYELVVCELTMLYAASGQEETEEISAYGRENGTSGNQHDYAKALSRLFTDNPADLEIVANSVSALSPITGDADYSRAALEV